MRVHGAPARLAVAGLVTLILLVGIVIPVPGGLAAPRRVAVPTVPPADFDGDGFADLAIGVPGEKVNDHAGAGAVNVLYGSPAGLDVFGNQFWNQDSQGVQDRAERGDNFGAALAAGDFNGDGYTDLAVGVPGEEVLSMAGAGAVNVLMGSVGGLTAKDSQFWNQETPRVDEEAEPGDGFGSALASGDFNSDGFDDLAIGVPGESVGDIERAGAVNVLYGSSTGLFATGNNLWQRDRPGVKRMAFPDLRFGTALAAADFDADGFDDLAIAAPLDREVDVLRGSPDGITAHNPYNDRRLKNFGHAASLAPGDFNGRPPADLAVGSPTALVNNLPDAGVVNVFYSFPEFGLPRKPHIRDRWNQDKGGVKDEAAAQERFGASVVAGDFDADTFDDLAIGVPGELVGKDNRPAGGVHLLYGTSDGLRAPRNELWTQDRFGLPNPAEAGDGFGWAVTAGDYNNDGFIDLVIGVPFEGFQSGKEAGAVHVIYGSAAGLTTAGNQYWTQDSPGIQDDAEFRDRFGLTLR